MHGDSVALRMLSTVVVYHTAAENQYQHKDMSTKIYVQISTFDFSRLHSRHTSVARFLALPMLVVGMAGGEVESAGLIRSAPLTFLSCAESAKGFENFMRVILQPKANTLYMQV